MLRVVLFLALTVQYASAACPRGWPEFDGFCFSFVQRTIPWLDAFSECSSIGGRLAQIDSQAKNDWIAKQLGERGMNIVWIGGTKINSDTWEWVPSGNKFEGYTNWDTREPNNPSTEFCLEMRQPNYKWNNDKCSAKHEYVCEKSST